MAILHILTEPDDRLRVHAQPIERVDDTTRRFMHDMLDTMYDPNVGGIGLASIQVNNQQRILVIDLQDCDDEERKAKFFPLFVANPRIITCSEETTIMREGCLSLPKQSVEVERPKAITLQYLDYNNQEQALSSSGFLARVLQHEIDHLNGKLMIDYLSPLKRGVALRKLAKIKLEDAQHAKEAIL